MFGCKSLIFLLLVRLVPFRVSSAGLEHELQTRNQSGIGG
jgi:hypothetical protein